MMAVEIMEMKYSNKIKLVDSFHLMNTGVAFFFNPIETNSN